MVDKYDLVVDLFAFVMKARLRANSHKGDNWQNDSIHDLLMRLSEENI